MSQLSLGNGPNTVIESGNSEADKTSRTGSQWRNNGGAQIATFDLSRVR